MEKSETNTAPPNCNLNTTDPNDNSSKVNEVVTKWLNLQKIIKEEITIEEISILNI